MRIWVGFMVCGKLCVELDYTTRTGSTGLFSALASELQIHGFVRHRLVIGEAKCAVVAHRTGPSSLDSVELTAAQWASKRVSDVCSSRDTLLLYF